MTWSETPCEWIEAASCVATQYLTQYILLVKELKAWTNVAAEAANEQIPSQMAFYHV